MSLGGDLVHGFDVAVWARDVLRLDLDPVQADLLARRGRRELLNCTRQWGKSTTTTAAALHEALYAPASKVVIVAPSLRQSGLLLSTVERLARVAGVEFAAVPGPDPGLRFACGDVMALPSSEATTRGYAGVTFLIVDEAARVADEMWHSVTAYLATTDGRVWLLSTPFGQRGFFHEEHGAGRYRVTTVRADECPRISAAFLAERRASMPAWSFAQEYNCEFVSSEGAVFRGDLIDRSVSEEVTPLCL